MDLKKISGFESQIQPATGLKKDPAAGIGPSFRETLKEVSGSGPANAAGMMPGQAPGGMPKALDGVKFSNHAVERMQSRGIRFSQDDLGRLNDAIAKAAAKGSKDSLVLMNDSALIVSVKNNTVVTVMDKNALKENVFTNIDSTIVM